MTEPTEHPTYHTLFKHRVHPHKPKNVNVVHNAEQKASGLNTFFAVTLTKIVGTMWTAYVFIVLAVIGLLGLLGLLNPFTFLLATWISQQFLQLVLLPVIMVGQNVLSRKQELQIDEMDATSQHSFSDIEQIVQHLNAQDEQILRIVGILESRASMTVTTGATPPFAALETPEMQALLVKQPTAGTDAKPLKRKTGEA